jgi:PST family polysaccharide transporter
MTSAEASRGTLKASAILGGSSLVSLLLNLARTKVAALVLGPAGIGLIGLVQGLMITGGLIGSMGLNVAGVRQVAAATASGEPERIHSARAALILTSLALGLLAALALWLFRNPIATHVLGDSGLGAAAGWMALGAFLAVVGSAQFALLSGLRDVNRLAWGQAWAALASTVLGAASLIVWGGQALILFVLIAPIATCLTYRLLISRLPRLDWTNVRRALAMDEARTLLRIGFPVMLGALVGSAGFLAARTIVNQSLGLEQLGQFQAAWLISLNGITFILNAMTADYLPRLTAAQHKAGPARAIIGRQQEIGLLLAAPILVGLLAFAPWVVVLLFSREFAETASLLRWQIMGDALRVAFWPLSYALLAAGASRRYLLGESVGVAAFLTGLWLLLPVVGIDGAGMSYVLMAAAQTVALALLVWQRYGFAGSLRATLLLMPLLALCGLVLWLGPERPPLAAAIGALGATLYGLLALARLAALADLGGPAGWLAARARTLRLRARAIGWGSG